MKQVNLDATVEQTVISIDSDQSTGRYGEPGCTSGMIWMAEDPVPRIATFFPSRTVESIGVSLIDHLAAELY